MQPLLADALDNCTGRAWIGISYDGYISTSASVSCSGGHVQLGAQNWLTRDNRLNTIAEDWQVCPEGGGGSLAGDCTYVQSGTSGTRAEVGKLYCSVNYADSIAANVQMTKNSGYGYACLTAQAPPTTTNPPGMATQPALCSAPSNPPTAKHYINIFTTAPAYDGPSTLCARVGENYSSTNPQYVFCRREGDEVRVGSDYNHWWLWTDLDTGGKGWIPAYYIQGQGNDQADDMNTGQAIPLC